MKRLHTGPKCTATKPHERQVRAGKLSFPVSLFRDSRFSHTICLCHTPIISPEGGAPFLEVLQYQVDAWSGRSKLLFQLPAPKIHLIYCPRIEDVSDIKLIRTDTTLDLSQKAEKRCRAAPPGRGRPRSISIQRTVSALNHPSCLIPFASSTVLSSDSCADLFVLYL